MGLFFNYLVYFINCVVPSILLIFFTSSSDEVAFVVFVTGKSVLLFIVWFVPPEDCADTLPSDPRQIAKLRLIAKIV